MIVNACQMTVIENPGAKCTNQSVQNQDVVVAVHGLPFIAILASTLHTITGRCHAGVVVERLYLCTPRFVQQLLPKPAIVVAVGELQVTRHATSPLRHERYDCSATSACWALRCLESET